MPEDEIRSWFGDEEAERRRRLLSRRTVGGTSASCIANRAAGIAVRANGLKEISAAVSANSKAMEIATRVRINGLELVGLIVARSHDAITEVRSGVTVQMRLTAAIRIRTISTIKGRIREVQTGARHVQGLLRCSLASVCDLDEAY